MKKVTLFISRSENWNGYYLVVVNGEGFTDSVNETVAARIRGDDSWFDDRLFSIGAGGFERVFFDGTFSLARTVHQSILNEDWGKDEIYALADVGGRTYKSNP